MREKVILLGLDGADYKVIRRGIEEGLLPNFQEVDRRGLMRGLNSTVPPATPPSWTSMITGVSPGRHGVLDFYHLNESRFNTLKDVFAPTLWEILELFDFPHIIFQYPLTYPRPSSLSYYLSGFPFEGIDSYPPDLKAEIEEMEIRPLTKFEAFDSYLNKGIVGLNRFLRRQLDAKARAFSHLLERFPWVLSSITIMELDLIQHFLFDDPEATMRVYMVMDSFLGKMIKISEIYSAKLVLVSDHGFREASYTLHIGELLRREGLIGCSTGQLVGAFLINSILDLGLRTPLRNLLMLRILKEFSLKRELGNRGSRIFDVLLRKAHHRDSTNHGYRSIRIGSTFSNSTYLTLYDEALEDKIEALRSNVHIKQVIRAEDFLNGPLSNFPCYLLEYDENTSAINVLGSPKVITMSEASMVRKVGIHDGLGVFGLYSPEKDDEDVFERVSEERLGVSDLLSILLALLRMPFPEYVKIPRSLAEAMRMREQQGRKMTVLKSRFKIKQHKLSERVNNFVRNVLQRRREKSTNKPFSLN